MNILDCTLRDGGYINNWNFSESDINGITKYLNKANIEFVELGYLSNTKKENGTMFNTFKKIKEINIPLNKKIIMINYGEYPIELIPQNKEYVFGIRIVFKKSQWREAMDYSKKLLEKNYKIFLQPMQTISYKDKEILELLENVNILSPYAIYIVDSFGEMKKEDLVRIVSLYTHNLNNNILIGFHSHNNFQLSFSLAIEFLKINTKQDKIIDSSVYGMGRGAGNLNTELFTAYLNKNLNTNYKIEYLLKIMDLYLEKIYQKERWGYNLGHFLSASLGCHPNYASYLLEKVNIGVEIIKNILEMIPENEKSIFNKGLIENLYLEYQKNSSNKKFISDEKDIKIRENLIVLGPGTSVIDELDKLNKFIKERKNLTIIALNHKNKFIKSDYILFTNEKRFEEFNENFSKEEKIIISSNIDNINNVDFIIDYDLYSKSGRESLASDILFNFIEKNKDIKNIYIAGMDGFLDNKNNYIFETVSSKDIKNLNNNISKKINSLNKKIQFLTKSIYMED